jgi:hypothetical protein
MPQRLRVTLLSMVLAAAFLIGGAPQCQAATAGRGTLATLTAPGWWPTLWATVRSQVIPNGGSYLHQPAKVLHPVRNGHFLPTQGGAINPDGSACSGH